ncbi:PilZ domain-containing protein [Alkalimarinus sediminis]|uniref:PilZ domain-containing protein n=1 Tax=Alkalimarinus sediminis TaxID=1632866 RepID=A0A9E8KNX5_9ALTE|nr:PilZ domain-containing protein [Alkalimarinus sediminis]UZW74149.1 PilZ domain-containing protein [Alkalimarinus sediminis]
MKSQRKEERYDVYLPLVLESKGSRIMARSRNLSKGGASISLVDPINTEDIDEQGSITIRTRTGNIKTAYEVTYRRENIIGIRFSDISRPHIEVLSHSLTSKPIEPNLQAANEDNKRATTLLGSLKRRSWILLRITSILTANLFWPILKRAVNPEVVFAVYGTRGDQRAYVPDWFRPFFPPIAVAAYIKDRSSKGVMVSSVYSEEELASDSDKVRKYISDLQKEFPNVKRFALVGRLPGFSMKAGIEIVPPLVEGAYGTRFAMYESAMQIASKLNDKAERSSIAILGGAGRIGASLIDDLTESFHTIIAIDPRYTEETTSIINGSKVLYTKRGERLREAKLVLVLTARGNDILPMISHMTPGTVVADDTHPCIKRPARELLSKQGVDLWKTVVTSDDYNMYPRMPNFHNNNIPGCLLEALVLNATGDDALSSPQRFFDEAKKCGYKTLLIRHPDDS